MRPYISGYHQGNKLWSCKVSGCNPVALVTVCQVVMVSAEREREGAPLSSRPGLIILPQMQLLLQPPVSQWPPQLHEGRDNTLYALLTSTRDSLERDLYLLSGSAARVILRAYFRSEMCLVVFVKKLSCKTGFYVVVTSAGRETWWGGRNGGKEISGVFPQTSDVGLLVLLGKKILYFCSHSVSFQKQKYYLQLVWQIKSDNTVIM